MSNTRRAGRRERPGPQIQSGWRDGVRVYKALSGNARRRYLRIIPMIPCRYCAAPEYEMCVREGGQVSDLFHAVRSDDAWEVVRGVAPLEDVLRRMPEKSASWPEQRRKRFTTIRDGR